MLLKILPKAELIDLIGESLYDQTTDFLEAIFSGSEDEEDLQLFRKKNIVRLALSFLSAESLRKPKFWKDVINRLDSTAKQRLKTEFDIHLELSNQDLVDSCLRAEFENYGLRIDVLAEQSEPRAPVAICEIPEYPFQRLKIYQQEIYQSVLTKLEIPRNRLIVQMPTGSGKTRTAIEIVADVLLEHPSASVLWLAHSVDLIDQAAESFSQVWAHLGEFDLQLCLVDGQREGLAQFDGTPSFIVSTFKSMISFLSNSTDAERLVSSLTLVVVDEAHMSLAPTYRQLVENVVSQGAHLVGLTATPGRSREGLTENEQLAEFYLRNIVELRSPNHTTVFSYLRSIGIMSRSQMEELHGSDIELSASEIRTIQREFSVPTSVLVKLGKEARRNVHIVSKLRKLINENPTRSVILFACSVEHSKFLVSVCMYLGLSAAHVDGNTPPGRRRALLQDFRSGDIQILSNFGVLTTGFDAPKTDVIFIARPTASIVMYSQMIGRGLRGPMIGGTEKCLIVNVRDNLIGMPHPDDIYDYFEDYYVN